jgi:TRAP transporter TAXI family solute receptor
VQNLTLLRQGALEAALSQSDLIDWAYTGTGIDQGKPPYEGLRVVANLYTEALHLVVRANSPIRGPRDLRGKAVSLGEEGSGTLVEARLLLKAYGVKESEIHQYLLDPGTASDRLVAGELDAFFVIGGAPLGAVSDTAARVPIRLIPFDDAVAERFLRTQPFYVGTFIGDEAYPDVPPIRTLGIPAQLVVRSDIPDAVVYGITRALWHESTRRLLEASGPAGRQIALAAAVRSVRVPLHPGAERYYRDVGLVGANSEASDPVAARR